MSKLSQSKRPRVAIPISGASRFAKYTPGFMQYAPGKKAPSRRDRIRVAAKHRRLAASRVFGCGGARRLGSTMTRYAASAAFGYGGVRHAGRHLARMTPLERASFKVNPGVALRRLRHEHR